MSKIFDTDNWREIGATLSRNKTRTFLTAFGIFWGTAMLALLLGGAGGLRGLLMRNFAGLSTNLGVMWTQNTTVSFRGFNKGSSWLMTEGDLQALRQQAPQIEYISGLIPASGTITRKDKSREAQIMGANADYFKIQLPNLISGRVFNESDFFNAEKVGVIGRDLASHLFGNEDPVGQFVNAGGVYVKVIGVVSQLSEASIGGSLNDMLTVPSTTLRRAWGLGDKVYFTPFTLKPGHTLSEVKPIIKRVICARHPISPDDEHCIGYMDVAEQFQQVEGLFLAVSLLALFVGAGTLLAGIIGVGNIMWIIVKERTTEIGIRRAIGARPSDIIMMILSEGMVLTAVAGIAGISFATIILALAEKMLTDPVKGGAGFNLPFGTAMAILVTFMTLGSLAGLIPSIKAMKIKPIEAINDK
ncbi:MAG: FtsX-like permease family protein [Bacteroides sp.]|nr:FtsX-like permease family protein [Bacteroides sp.]